MPDSNNNQSLAEDVFPFEYRTHDPVQLNECNEPHVYVCEENWSAIRDEIVDMHKQGIDIETFAKNNPDKLKGLENRTSITWLDPHILRHTGRSFREFENLYVAFHEPCHEFVPFLKALLSGQTGAVSTGQDRVLSPQGDIFHSRGIFIAEDWSRIITISTNVTRFKIHRAEIARIGREMIQVIETANAPIFGVDSQGRVNEWNNAAVALTGFKKSDVLGRNLVTEFISEAHKESVKQVLDKALLGEETANYEFPLYTKTGKRVDILLNASTRRDPDGVIVGVIGIGQDLTELNLAKAQLIQASKLASLGEMSTSVAHELNQP